MEQLLDPVQIITRPSQAVASDREQVLGFWIHTARKAGWQVEQVGEPTDWSAGECGVVEIEGLRYLIRVGPRSRGRAINVPDRHVGAFVANTVVQNQPVASYPVFTLTAWAEPIVP
ncbi:hypothetical protein ACWGDX_20050 [Streptomyces sp. NPDC055025]